VTTEQHVEAAGTQLPGEEIEVGENSATGTQDPKATRRAGWPKRDGKGKCDGRMTKGRSHSRSRSPGSSLTARGSPGVPRQRH
jgi:hypothetical protein